MKQKSKAIFVTLAIIQILTYFAPVGSAVLASTKNIAQTEGNYDINLKISQSTEEKPNPDNTNDTLNLEWEWSSSAKEKTRYAMKRTDDTRTTYIDIPNIDTNNVIKVLNVYPTDGVKDNLKNWMDAYGKVQGKPIIEVTPVSLSEFKTKYEVRNQEDYLKDENGKYKYDVIFFGSADSNGGTAESGHDLSENAAKAVGDFIEAGHSAIFGHDSICRRGNQNHPQFAELGSKYVGIYQCDSECAYSGSTQVRINREGVFTSYPHNIGGEGTKLTIPTSHVLGQHAEGDIWLKFCDTDNGHIYADMENTTPEKNFYLTTYQEKESYGTCAMIQTGHSSGRATPDEEKIIANLIFYLCNTDDTSTSLTDISFSDITGPNAPTEIKASKTWSDNGTKATVTYAATDVGTTYTYQVEARNDGTSADDPADAVSNTISATTEASGVKSYEYVIDGSADTKLSENRVSTQTTEADHIVCTVNEKGPTYLHIRAIDENGNVGKQADILVAQKEKLTIKGIWKDDTDALNLRPTQAQVKLSKDDGTSETITLTSTDWTQTKSVNLLDEQGAHTYTIEAVTLDTVNDEGDKYVTTIDINGKEGKNITGTQTGETTINVTNLLTGTASVTVEKKWDDYHNIRGKRPEKVEIELYENDEKLPSKKLEMTKPDETNPDIWANELFTNLAKYDENGKVINYSIKEQEVNRGDLKEYKEATYGEPKKEGNNTTITVTDSYVDRKTTVEGEITQVATPSQIGENISGTNPEVEYNITFNVTIENFAGKLGAEELTLMYDLSTDERMSNVIDAGDGFYNEANKTIIWKITKSKLAEILGLEEDDVINTYKTENGKVKFTITKTIKVGYEGIDVENAQINNHITGNIEIDHGDSEKANETFPFEANTVTKLDKGNLVVKYLDADNENHDIEINGETTKTETTMLVGDEYQAEAKEFEDYWLKQEAENKTGKILGTGNTEVIHYYNKKHYNVEAGITNGNAITIENKTTNKKETENTETIVEKNVAMDVTIHNNVTVTFEPKRGYYVSQIEIDGKVITDPDEIKAYLNETSNTYEITINDNQEENGAEHTHQEPNGGIMANHKISVICEKIPVTIIVKYVDEEGNEIAEPYISESGVYCIGDEYKTEPIEIEHYTYAEKYDGIPTGTINETEIVVTYYYNKKQYEITTKMENGTITPSYQVEALESANIEYKAQEGYQVSKILINNEEYAKEYNKQEGTITIEKVTGPTLVNIICERIPGTIIVEYKNEQGKTLAKSTIIDGFVGDEYVVEPLNIKGYVFDHSEGDTQGQIEAGTKTITFIYKTAKQKDVTPKTGTVNITNYVAVITMLSIVGIIILKRKYNN